MKKLLLIFVLIITAGIAFAVTQQSTTPAPAENTVSNKKILIAYFSWSGNTKTIAEKIQTLTGGELYEIVPETPYPTDREELTVTAAEEKEKNINPPIKNTVDIANYDVIFIGTPVWWYTMASPVRTFLTTNNFEGKTIIPFITHGGGGEYSIAEEMGNFAKGAKLLSPAFVVHESGNIETDENLKNWVDSLEY